MPDRENEERNGKWGNRSLGKIVVVVLVFFMIVYSIIVLITVFNTKEQLLYESQSSREYSEKVCCSIGESQSEHEPVQKCCCNNKGSVKIFLYHVICIVFIIVFGVTVTVLFMLLIKDDSGIRYEKLDELNSIKDKLLECNSEIAWGKNKDVTKTVANEKNECTETTTTKKIYNRIDLLKHYMSCVTDI